MGQAKREWEEAGERGWSEPDGFVCQDCIEDEFLKAIIQQQASSRKCSFCGGGARGFIAAPVSALMESISSAVHYFFNDPTRAGVPWDDGPIIEGISTADMLMSIPLNCHDDLFEVVTDAFHETLWVDAADGHWSSSHAHEAMEDSWHGFVRAVKHDTRFHFHTSPPDAAAGPQEINPGDVLATIGQVVKSLGLVSAVASGVKLFRARVRGHASEWQPDETTMGAPPSSLARAGRMNPAGISYMYCAMKTGTATAETVGAPPFELVMAEFETTRDLTVLNLSDLPAQPSIFDDQNRRKFESLSFLHSFVSEISQPVRKDGSEHIDYVPSQVVCEWFAQVFRPRSGLGRLDGLLYPSAVAPGGRNLVIFPTERGYRRSFDTVKYLHATATELQNWTELTAMLTGELL